MRRGRARMCRGRARVCRERASAERVDWRTEEGGEQCCVPPVARAARAALWFIAWTVSLTQHAAVTAAYKNIHRSAA